MNLRRKMSSSEQADTLHIESAVIYKKRKQKYYGTPTLLGCFSIDRNQEFSEDKTQLKYLSLPGKRWRLSYDLNKDSEKYVVCDHTKFSLTGLLKWISKNRSKLCEQGSAVSKKQKLNTDFVLTRKDIVTICRTPYNTHGSLPWMIYARKFDGIIYMLKVSTQEEIDEVNNRTLKDKETLMGGNKFAKYITSDTNGGAPNIDSPVNEWEHFFVVAKKTFDDHVLLYTAEIDAADENYCKGKLPECSLEQYVEIKAIHEKILSEKKKFERFKLLVWWLQSHVIGIPKIIYGHYNDKGIADAISVIETKTVPGMAKKYWSPNACFNFLNEFLSFVKKRVTDPEVTYEFLCKNGEIKCTKKTSPEIEILPEWFILSPQQGREKASTSGTSG